MKQLFACGFSGAPFFRNSWVVTPELLALCKAIKFRRAIHRLLVLGLMAFSIPAYAIVDPNGWTWWAYGWDGSYFERSSPSAVCDHLTSTWSIIRPGERPRTFYTVYGSGWYVCSLNETIDGGQITVQRSGSCFPGYQPIDDACVLNAPLVCPNGQCKQRGGFCGESPGTLYPIHGVTGNKYWFDSDYASSAIGRLRFSRYYNSQSTGEPSNLGAGWRHTYDRSIVIGVTTNNTAVALAARADGKAYSFAVNVDTYTAQDADVKDKLTRLSDGLGYTTGWKYEVAADDTVETYNAIGKLISIRDRFGPMQTLIYSDAATPPSIAPKPDLLIRVTDSFGRLLQLTYDNAGRLKQMTDPAGGQYLYGYDTGNNLVAVTYPDNRIKGYHYNEPALTGGASLPNSLTGVTDENGVRFASYFYNAQGQAVTGEQAGGVNKYQITFGTNSTTITDPLGTARTYTYQNIWGVDRTTGLSQPGGSGCGAASSTTTYDANGNVASRADFNGNVTKYAYDLSRNLETSRVEGFGKPEARTISTQWHSTYRLPTKIAEPLRITTLTYEATGNLLNKAVQATNDAAGAQGFTAQLIGAARTWSWTYNSVGQVLTATGPRTDVVDRTTYAYDATGNLIIITNAAGHVTTLSNYDANGRVGKITDPNGITTDMSYHPRGWLLSRTVSGPSGGAELTKYDYDGVGQLVKVTQPDGATVNYTYDPAHRLVNIADSLGNSIAYTLDAMGNRINEQIKDPTGTLARQTTRIYDTLNRLQQVTGAAQ